MREILILKSSYYVGKKDKIAADKAATASMRFELNKMDMNGTVVIGEGASGGALVIGICDRFLMMQNTWYSVISPEGCASILFRDASKAEQAAEALKVTPNDMIEMGICDKIIAEPNGGAHRDRESASKNLKLFILEALDELGSIKPELFNDLRKNPIGYPYLNKIFDSNNFDFENKFMIYEINYKLFYDNDK